ncbi:MAG: hypothetical protein PVJ11_01400 [Syntrophobacterales bacterium]
MSILLKVRELEEMISEIMLQNGVTLKLLQLCYEIVTGGFY